MSVWVDDYGQAMHWMKRNMAGQGKLAQPPKETVDVMNNDQREFNFTGGAEKIGRVVKFFCFPNVFGTEMFLSEALKKGYIQRLQLDRYRIEADIKYFKIFYKQDSSSFGTESLYQSFFFELDPKAEYEYTIKPPRRDGRSCSWTFKARGRFMEDVAIKKHFSNTGIEEPDKKSSYFFYQRQMPLSLEILRQMVTKTQMMASGLSFDPNEYFRVIR